MKKVTTFELTSLTFIRRIQNLTTPKCTNYHFTEIKYHKNQNKKLIIYSKSHATSPLNALIKTIIFDLNLNLLWPSMEKKAAGESSEWKSSKALHINKSKTFDWGFTAPRQAAGSKRLSDFKSTNRDKQQVTYIHFQIWVKEFTECEQRSQHIFV